MPIAAEINSAHVHDVHFLDQIKLLQLSDCLIVADKEYLSIERQKSLWQACRIEVITPLRSNMKNHTYRWNPYFRTLRKQIETLFSQLCDQFHIRNAYAKSFEGLCARICSKITGVAIFKWINFTNNKPINRIKYALSL